MLFPLESEFWFNKSSVTIISFFSFYDEKSHTLPGKQKGSGAANPDFPLFFLPPSYVCSLQGPFCASPALASSVLLVLFFVFLSFIFSSTFPVNKNSSSPVPCVSVYNKEI